MRPPRPEAARFDLAQNAWVLSRYPDVWAALREPYLWPVSGKREIQPESRDADGRLTVAAGGSDALCARPLADRPGSGPFRRVYPAVGFGPGHACDRSRRCR